MFYQSYHSLVHFYRIPGANFTLLEQFSSKHLQKLQEIQSLQHVTKHEKRLLLYIHITNRMQKTVNSPTTSVVDMSLLIFLIFSYIFHHNDSASTAEWSSRMMEKDACRTVISALNIYFALGELYYTPFLSGRQMIWLPQFTSSYVRALSFLQEYKLKQSRDLWSQLQEQGGRTNGPVL